ncbi:MAG: ABC transporter ATP-binding protein, partial [Woeseiaceae bacterium]
MKKTKNNLFYLLLDLWSHFRRRRKIQFFGLLLLSIITAFAEILSLGAVLPFLGALTDPNTLFDAPFMQTFLRVFSITTPQEMLLPLTLVFIGSAIIAGITRLLQLWANTRVSFSTGAELSVEVYRRTLYQSYSVHVTRNSSAIINAVSTKIPLVTNGTIVPVISLISSGFI